MSTSITPDPRTAEIEAEAKFINAFGGKEDVAPTAKLRTPAAKADTTPASDDDAEDQEEADASTAADDGSEDDAEHVEQETAESEDAETAETEEAATEGEESEEDEEASEDEEDPAAAEEAQTEAVVEALEKAGLKMTLKDIPAEARPLVKKKLDHIQAWFTRTAQEQTKFREERRTLMAEKEFFEKNPVLAIAELLAKRPELEGEVAVLIEKFEDPDKKRLFERDVADSRKAIADKITEKETAQERASQRVAEMETYARTAADKLGLPREIVEEAIGNAMMLNEGGPDLTERQMDQVIAKVQRSLRGFSRQTKLANAKASIKERTNVKKTSTPAVRAGSGVTAASPSGKKAPKNDAEFLEMMVAKL